MTDIRNNLEFAAAARDREIRVMIVDDSVVARSVFDRMLATQPGINIVCSASNSEDALSYLASDSVDIILLDIELPGRSGLDALPDLLSASKDARILIVSSFAERNGPAAIKALSLGACDTLAKPGRAGYSGDFSRQLREKVIRLGGKAERRSQIPVKFVPDKGEIDNLQMPDCIAIGASTGGIPSIYAILQKLDSSIDCPIFITQHLPTAFMSFFAKQLAGVSGREVKIADAGTEIAPNTIYLAPGDSHLNVESRGDATVIAAAKSTAQSRYCPSVDLMFASLSAVYGPKMLAIVLSGMGNDGSKSADLVVKNGGTVLVQDVDSSVVWGMPGAIARQGLASAILSPEGIVKRLNEMTEVTK